MWDWLNGAYTLVCDTLPEDLLQFVGSESLVCAHCKSGTAIPKALNASTMKMAAAKAMAMIGRAALAKNLHIADLSPVELVTVLISITTGSKRAALARSGELIRESHVMLDGLAAQ
jgi:hypothetical protein